MRDGLHIGHVGELARRVSPERTIRLGAGGGGAGAAVFSTPAMIDLMEHAARAALEPFLEPGEESVGVRVNVEHLAATPMGASVRAAAKVTGIDGRVIDFDIEAFDESQRIGRGTHRRAVIRMDQFKRRLGEAGEAGERAAMAGEAGPFPARRDRATPPQDRLGDLTTLRVEVDGAIAYVTLNRPDQLNTVNERMTSDWERLVAWLAGAGDRVRVVIVTGEGRAFCAGDDVKEVATLTPDHARALSLRQAKMYLAFEQLPQVMIAAINGYALGGGCVAACACDFRIAATGATLGMPEILLGWPPGYGLAQLRALVGKARALELCLTGRQVSAREALEWGLVHQVVPGNRLLAAARELADRLLAMPTKALRETKALIHAHEGEDPKRAYLADTEAYIRCLQTADAKEGIAALIEKRPARFEGR